MGLQNPDGGFPAADKPGNPSCLNNTCYGIGGLIRDAGEEAGESLRKACEWVLSTQSREGAFIEPEELASVPNLPSWVHPGKPTGDMIQLVAYLMRAGYGDREETKRAIAYLLRRLRNPDGSFKVNYLIWGMIEVLRRMGSPEGSESVQEAIKATRHYFQRNMNDIPALVWCIGSLRSAGLSKDHELVRWTFNRLMELRNEDGGWSNEDLEGRIQSQTDPIFTKVILEELRAYGLIL
jgi:hypothetical protein